MSLFTLDDRITMLKFVVNVFQLNDAYEEVDEQRQVVAQWKRKTQKLQGEMHDQKLLLEEQVNLYLLLKGTG